MLNYYYAPFLHTCLLLARFIEFEFADQIDTFETDISGVSSEAVARWMNTAAAFGLVVKLIPNQALGRICFCGNTKGRTRAQCVEWECTPSFFFFFSFCQALAASSAFARV